MKGMIIMKIAVIGYILGSNRITVSYDETNKKFLVEEEYRDEESGIYRYSCKTFSSPESQEADVEVTLTVMQAENLESIGDRPVKHNP